MKVAIFRIDRRKQSDIIMKRELRYHPKMKQKGYLNWPPGWAGSYMRRPFFQPENRVFCSLLRSAKEMPSVLADLC